MAVTWLIEKKGIAGAVAGGFTKLADRYGDEKGEATHVRMTVEEYDQLISNLNAYKKKLSKEETAHQKDVKDINDAAVAYKNKANAEAQAKVDAAEARANAAEAERDRQTNLNANLLRITKERANAKRGLQPKKSHSGYRFTGKIMQTKTISGHDKKEGAIYTDVWTATLETPYDGTIPINQIRDRIFNDLKGTEGILGKLYVKYWTYKDSDVIWKGTYAEAIEDAKDQNYLFDYKFMVNPKSKLWEVQITTLKSIRALAEMMA